MNKLLLLILIFCISCGQKEQPEENLASENEVEFTDTIVVETKRLVTLSPEAINLVSQWLAYVTAQNEIESMKNATGEDLVQNSEPLMQIMEALQTTMPDSLQVPAVEARANVLLTKAILMHQFSLKKDKNPVEIFEVANDIIVEFGNFKLQLNELFLKTPQDFELELDREFEEALEQDTLPESLEVEETLEEDTLPKPLEFEQI